MNEYKHLCNIPCNSLPLACEADFGFSLKPVLHCDRIAPFNVLIYLLKGSMEIIEDGVPYTLTPGSLFFLKSGVHHWGEKPFESGTAWYYVHFYCEAATENMKPLKKDFMHCEEKSLSPEYFNCYMPLPKIINLEINNNFEKKLESMIHLFKSSNPLDMFKRNLAFSEILICSFDLWTEKAVPSKKEGPVQTIIDFLEENYCSNFTSEALEKAVGLTYKYICALFKAHTGRTIKEYQLMLRIKKAKKLLCETEMSISDIAAETGFYDAFYFSKIFKRENELPPQKFRSLYIPRI